MDWKDELYERTKNEETIFNMKRFKVEGWYRLHDEKDFEQLTLYSNNTEDAITYFKNYFGVVFYKIDIIEL